MPAYTVRRQPAAQSRSTSYAADGLTKVRSRRCCRASSRVRAEGARWSKLPPNATVAPSGINAAAAARVVSFESTPTSTAPARRAFMILRATLVPIPSGLYTGSHRARGTAGGGDRRGAAALPPLWLRGRPAGLREERRSLLLSELRRAVRVRVRLHQRVRLRLIASLRGQAGRATGQESRMQPAGAFLPRDPNARAPRRAGVGDDEQDPV